MSGATAMDPLIELRGISKHFGEGERRVDALRDATLSVRAGEVVGIARTERVGKEHAAERHRLHRRAE